MSGLPEPVLYCVECFILTTPEQARDRKVNPGKCHCGGQLEKLEEEECHAREQGEA